MQRELTISSISRFLAVLLLAILGAGAFSRAEAAGHRDCGAVGVSAAPNSDAAAVRASAVTGVAHQHDPHAASECVCGAESDGADGSSPVRLAGRIVSSIQNTGLQISSTDGIQARLPSSHFLPFPNAPPTRA